MKTRLEFVSNSSSTSFIINSTYVKTENLNTLQVLKQLLLVQIREIASYDVELALNAYSEVMRWIDDNEKTTSNPTFQFPSCNYDTFIWKRKDGAIRINTCNNTDWEDALEKVNGIHHGDGADGGQWEDMSMKKQSADWDSTFQYKQPDRDKIIVLKPDTQYSDLPILKENQFHQNRFIGLLQE